VKLVTENVSHVTVQKIPNVILVKLVPDIWKITNVLKFVPTVTSQAILVPVVQFVTQLVSLAMQLLLQDVLNVNQDTMLNQTI